VLRESSWIATNKSLSRSSKRLKKAGFEIVKRAD